MQNTSKSQTVTLPIQTAIQIADCLYSLAQFAMHAETITYSARKLMPEINTAGNLIHTLEEIAVNVQNLNGIELSINLNALIEEAQ